ncbi:MAG: LuxR C-terminal-related transcriptional regulator [Halioglobus sp.]
MSKHESYSVVIADDHEIIREAVLDIIKQASVEAGESYELLAFAENGLEAIAAVKAHKPDLLFLDVSMPLASGAEVIHDIRRWSPDTKIIVFTGVTAPGLLASLVETRVEGLFSKGSSVKAMRDKLPTIMLGGRFISPDLLDVIEQGRQGANLTERERQTLNMVVSGKTNKEIAEVLNISPKTVDKHRTALMGKLGVHSVAQLMARAIKDGLIDPT